MRFRVQTISERVDEMKSWRRWFAWHPVRVDKHIIWLETIERRYVFHIDGWWEYR